MATEIPGVTHKKRNWLKIILIAVVVFIAFVALIIGCVFSMGAPVMKSGEQFLTQLSSGQVDQAYESAAIQFKQTVSRDQFDQFLAGYPVMTKVKSASFNSFNIENNNFGTISGTITATDGQVSPITMQLVNENGGWKVLNMDLNPPAANTESTGN